MRKCLVFYLYLTSIPYGGILENMKTEKTKLFRRLRIIEGQIRALQEMISKDVYCIDIITQTSAVKQALSRVEDLLMEKHLNHCLINQIKKGKDKKAVSEVLKVYQLKRK